jgi:hypothetical protein
MIMYLPIFSGSCALALEDLAVGFDRVVFKVDRSVVGCSREPECGQDTGGTPPKL